MTAGWNSLPFTLLPKVPPLIGFFRSVAPAGRPRPCRTSLLCPQSRVLSAPPLLQSCLTGPLDALCVSAFPVNLSSLTTMSVSLLSPLFSRRFLLHPTMTCRLTGFRTVLCPGFHLSMVGGVVTPPPGSGTQSWLFCPLISLGLALAESRLGVPPCSTGNREQVPSEQSQFWTARALSTLCWTMTERCILSSAWQSSLPGHKFHRVTWFVWGG